MADPCILSSVVLHRTEPGRPITPLSSGEPADVRMKNTTTSTELSLTKCDDCSPSKLNGHTQLIAPMPGVITFCEKKIGDDVKAGDVVLILEAMKMENLIMAPSVGRVVSILCKEGQRVTKGTVLALVG